MILTMNIAFFLTPKKDVVFEKLTSTMRQAVERLEFHHYSAIPIIDESGKYIGILTEGDLLRKMKNTKGLNFGNINKVFISDIPMFTKNRPVGINCNIEDLVTTAINQNFVPVLDDDEKFIGIIKRSAIINYCYEKMFQKTVKEA